MIKFSARTRTPKWTPEQDALLTEMFAAGVTHWDISVAINATFGTNFGESGARNRAYILGLRRPGNRPAVVWSADQNDELRRRVENKERNIDISAAMGITVAAISTQVFRLGIVRPSRAAPRPSVNYDTREAAQSDRRMRERINAVLNHVPAEYLVSVPLPPVPVVVLHPRNLTLAEIGRLECRWITNEDVTAPRYCGHAVEDGGGSWCPAHHNVVRARRGGPPSDHEKSFQNPHRTRAGSGPHRCAAVA